MKCSEISTPEYHPYDINPVICWNFHNMQYIPDIYLVKCRISGQHVPVCHIPVEFQGDAMLISYVYVCIHQKKKNLKIKEKINNHTVMII